MSRRLATIVGFLLLGCIVATVIGAWVYAALGYGVQNVLSVEGLRWLFVHALDDTHHALSLLLLTLLMVGSLQESAFCSDVLRRSASRRIRRATIVSLCVLLLLVGLLLSAMLVPSSQLLGLTGRLWPSPFMKGILPVTCFGITFVSVLHAWLSERMQCPSHLFCFLARGLSRHLPWLVVGLLGIFFYNLLCFVC